ncbi:MAG: hypothetical protein Q7S38_01585 [bacterium]|nr:hypothetical protein [bacterium]
MRFAKIISLVFHPVVLLLILPYLVIYRQTASEMYALKWVVFSSPFLVIGITLFLVERLRGVFSDSDISHQKERPKFYAIALILAFIYFAVSLFFKGIFFPISIIAFGIIIGLFLFDMVNTRIKASVHIGVYCAFVITVGILYQTFFPALVLPFLAWSRIKLHRHTILEIITGGVLGSLVTIATFLLAKYFYT